MIYYVVLGSAVYAAYEINFFYYFDGVMLLQSARICGGWITMVPP